MEVVIPQSPEVWGGRYFKFLEVTKAAALAYGNTVSVLEPFHCPAVDEFRKHYRHQSPNPPWFEMWCFEQWLLMYDWMKSTGRDVVFKIDSDCLVFVDLQRLWESAGKPRFTLPTPESFLTLEGAAILAEYILDSFKSGKEIDRCERGQCLCDGHLFIPFKQQMKAPDLQSPEQTMDTGIFNIHKGPSFEGHKDIWFVNGQPCWVRPDGYTRMLTIHCWGHAKHKMDVIWDQSRRSRGTAPVRLSIGDHHHA